MQYGSSRLADVIEDAGYRPRGIVHVGAHKGQEVERYLSLEPKLIVWIEAEETWMSRLNKLVRSSPPATRQMALSALITERDGETKEFHRYSNKGLSSSLYRPAGLMESAWPGVAPTGEVVRMISSRLDTTLKAAGVSSADVDVLALDVQGAELSALKGAGEYLDGVEFVEVELSQVAYYEGAPLADEVETLLAAAGFRRVTKLRQHGDVVFRRDHGASL